MVKIHQKTGTRWIDDRTWERKGERTRRAPGFSRYPLDIRQAQVCVAGQFVPSPVRQQCPGSIRAGREKREGVPGARARLDTCVKGRQTGLARRSSLSWNGNRDRNRARARGCARVYTFLSFYNFLHKGHARKLVSEGDRGACLPFRLARENAQRARDDYTIICHHR